MNKNVLTVQSIGNSDQGPYVDFEELSVWFDRTGLLADAMPGDVFELTKLEEPLFDPFADDPPPLRLSLRDRVRGT